MRVVAGSAGGLHLKSPKGVDLRPTQDRIKQAVFSSLADRVIDAVVLDLFCGTGSLGIEALSRGAQSATFVDQEARCIACVQENLAHCHLEGITVRQDVMAFLQCPTEARYSLIFADPPYDKTKGSLDDSPLLAAIRTWITPDGLLVFEHFSQQLISTPPGWEVLKTKRYGETGITFLSPL